MQNQAKNRVIKRYGNRKLYDTVGSRYVTLDEIAEMIQDGQDITVVDNQSREDLTSVTFAQIILEQQKKKSRMPLHVLRDMIRGPGETLTEIIRKGVTDPVQNLREGAGQRIEELKRASETTRDDLLTTLREWLEGQQRHVDDVQRKLEEKFPGGKDQLNDLRREFSELQHRFRDFEARLTSIRRKGESGRGNDEPGEGTPPNRAA